MTQTSFPIVGADFTDEQWSQTVGATGNGILDDFGNPYAVVVNTNDTVTLRPSTRSGIASAIVAGFGHRMDANETLTVPSGANTYHVGLLYDPKNTALPVRLVVLAGVTPQLTAGQQFMPIVIFVRAAGQTLVASKSYLVRPKITPTIEVMYEESLLKTSPLLFLNNTIAHATDTDATFRAAGTLAAPKWVSVADPGAILRTSLAQTTSATSNQWSTIAWNIEDSDRGGAHDGPTGGLLVMPKRGLIVVSWSAKFGTVQDKIVRTRLLRNNAAIGGGTVDHLKGNGSAEPLYNSTMQLIVNAGDDLRVQVSSEITRIPLRVSEFRFSYGYLSIG